MPFPTEKICSECGGRFLCDPAEHWTSCNSCTHNSRVAELSNRPPGRKCTDCGRPLSVQSRGPICPECTIATLTDSLARGADVA